MGSCEYRYTCPVKDCDHEKNIACVGRLIDYIVDARTREKKANEHEIENVEVEQRNDEPHILYLCDRRACKSCDREDGKCEHTLDIRHARNFELVWGDFYEVPYPPSNKTRT